MILKNDKKGSFISVQYPAAWRFSMLDPLKTDPHLSVCPWWHGQGWSERLQLQNVLFFSGYKANNATLLLKLNPYGEMNVMQDRSSQDKNENKNWIKKKYMERGKKGIWRNQSVSNEPLWTS